MLIRGSQAANKAGGKDEVEVKQQARAKSLLSLYAEAPTGEIRLEEFEQFSIDRLMGARACCRRAPQIPSQSWSLTTPLCGVPHSVERDRGPQSQGHKPRDGDRENPRGRAQAPG